MDEYRYVGSELELFAAARNWKSYWSQQVRPFLAGDVLEVGAGIGANTPFLHFTGTRRWVCLESDPQLATRMIENLKKNESLRACEAVCGTVQSVAGQDFDTIIYVDVLEHIEDDHAELCAAASRLRTGGHLIVIAPAHQWLFTPFDAAIGHFRRYNRAMLKNVSPPGLQVERILYLDSVGLAASAANRLFLRRSIPTQSQLRFWDRWMVPASRVLDKLLLFRAGKSALAVWRRA